MKKILLLAALAMAAGGAAFAQIGSKKIEADARIEKLLKEAGLQYNIDSEADFKLYYQVKDGRRQAVWIISQTQSIGPVEVRQLWSIGYVADAPPDARLALRLLEENGKLKLGAWLIRKMGDKYVAIVSAQIGADTDRISLLNCLSTVAATADDLEKELTGQDAY